MNIKTSSKPLRFLWLAALAGFAIGPVNAAIFVDIPGIQGDSIDADHLNWIDAMTAAGNFSGNSCGEFIVTTDVDRAFPLLAAAVVTGEYFPKIDVDFTKTINSSRVTVSKISLNEAVITSLATHLIGDEVTLPAQQFTIQPRSIAVKYSEFDDFGNELGFITRTVECGKVK